MVHLKNGPLEKEISFGHHHFGEKTKILDDFGLPKPGAKPVLEKKPQRFTRWGGK